MRDELSGFILGLVFGSILTAMSIGYYAAQIDATPVYEAGYAQGVADSQ